MKALSIRQPWAWLIVRPDIVDSKERQLAEKQNRLKTIENRTWTTKYRGEFLIHASKTWDIIEFRNIKRIFYNFPSGHIDYNNFLYAFKNGRLKQGGIIGRAILYEVCLSAFRNPWYDLSPYGFALKNILPLSFMPCKRQLGFFNVNYKVE